MDEFKTKLKLQIIEQLNLEDISPDDIDNEQSLFENDDLGLDSIDALEFIVLLDQHYNLKVNDPSKGKEIFYSINTLSEFIQSQTK